MGMCKVLIAASLICDTKHEGRYIWASDRIQIEVASELHDVLAHECIFLPIHYLTMFKLHP